jgi:hypothetical protein
VQREEFAFYLELEFYVHGDGGLVFRFVGKIKGYL